MLQEKSKKIILVMGVTGAGKSYLISKITGQDAVVGDSLESCTSEVLGFTVEHPNGDLVTLLDTPGFDDTNKTDTEILELVTDYLLVMYKERIKVTGIIYVQRISDIRMQGTSLKNLLMFEKLCGEKTFENVVLLTTRWDLVDENVGIKREKELMDKYWKTMIHKKSKVMRYKEDADINSVVEHLLGKEGVNLLIQKELSDGKSLLDTGAGTVINKDLIEAEKRYREDLEAARIMMEQAIKDKDEETRAIIQEEADRMTKKIAKIQEDRDTLERTMTVKFDAMNLERENTEKLLEEAQASLDLTLDEQTRLRHEYEKDQEIRMLEKEKMTKTLDDLRHENKVEKERQKEALKKHEEKMTKAKEDYKKQQEKLDRKCKEGRSVVGIIKTVGRVTADTIVFPFKVVGKVVDVAGRMVDKIA